MAKWRAVRTAKPCGPGRRCYGQAFAEVCASPTGRTASSIREVREARRKVRLPGERGISRPTIAQGRPSDWHHLYAAVRFFCVCFSRSRPRVRGQHPAFPAPSWLTGWSDQAKLGRMRSEKAEVYLRVEDVCDILRSCAPDAAQRPFDGALLSRGPCLPAICAAIWVPALRRNACTLQLVRDTRS